MSVFSLNKIEFSVTIFFFLSLVETVESEEAKPTEEPKKEPAMVA